MAVAEHLDRELQLWIVQPLTVERPYGYEAARQPRDRCEQRRYVDLPRQHRLDTRIDLEREAPRIVVIEEGGRSTRRRAGYCGPPVVARRSRIAVDGPLDALRES